ncbi:MAG TPA: RsmB/NOP family class I SAM-dependent RNA methyltransferase [Nevskiaceae bacterium]|nr:RsmB/NOP family class I SAM-dependent RNA methyltransferase [Nevskiaceae bacterium]
MAALRPFHLELAMSCLAEIQHARRPADAILQEAFRTRPQMGSKDRAGVSDVVYGVLRDYRRLEALVGSDPAALCKAQLEGVSADESKLTEAQRLNLPDWLYTSLIAHYGPEETRAIAAALQQPATVDLRVNTLRATRDKARMLLADDEIVAQPTSLSPIGLRLGKRAPLQATHAYKEGAIEPQDEGSQLLALLVAPKAGDVVVDYCAGAGGKSLALGALMQGKGRIHAFDSNAHRLAKLGPRAQRAGVGIVQPRVLKPTTSLKDLEGAADAILIDAPCSGSGVLRRNPELRLRSVSLDKLAAVQSKLLESAAPLVRPGGVLVYATCSLANAENEGVVYRFLGSHTDFVIDDAATVLRAQGVPYEGQLLKLLPHRHGTDGFFAARLRRRS